MIKTLFKMATEAAFALIEFEYKQTKILFCLIMYIALNSYYTGPGLTKFEDRLKRLCSQNKRNDRIFTA